MVAFLIKWYEHTYEHQRDMHTPSNITKEITGLDLKIVNGDLTVNNCFNHRLVLQNDPLKTLHEFVPRGMWVVKHGLYLNEKEKKSEGERERKSVSLQSVQRYEFSQCTSFDISIQDVPSLGFYCRFALREMVQAMIKQKLDANCRLMIDDSKSNSENDIIIGIHKIEYDNTSEKYELETVDSRYNVIQPTP